MENGNADCHLLCSPFKCTSDIQEEGWGRFTLLHIVTPPYHLLTLVHINTSAVNQYVHCTFNSILFTEFAKSHLFSWCAADVCFLGIALACFVRPFYFGWSLSPFQWPTNSVRASLQCREMAGSFSSHTLILSLLLQLLLLQLTLSAPSSPVANSYLPPPPETETEVLAGGLIIKPSHIQ